MDTVYWDIITLWGNEISLSTVEDLPRKSRENGRDAFTKSILPYSIYSQVLCTVGKLKEIPHDFPMETEEITISNQDIRTIEPNSK